MGGIRGAVAPSRRHSTYTSALASSVAYKKGDGSSFSKTHRRESPCQRNPPIIARAHDVVRALTCAPLWSSLARPRLISGYYTHFVTARSAPSVAWARRISQGIEFLRCARRRRPGWQLFSASNAKWSAFGPVLRFIHTALYA